MDNQVYIVKCPDYDQVEERMAERLAMMGGMSQFGAIKLHTGLLYRMMNP